MRVIAQNFVTDRNTPEAITVGLNAIREIFTSSPFAATEELLRDLTEVCTPIFDCFLIRFLHHENFFQYKSYKNKNVSMAARGLVTLFRNINPKLLCRKDRGRFDFAIVKFMVAIRSNSPLVSTCETSV